MGTDSRYSQRVSRFPTELDDGQKELLAALKAAVEKIRKDEAEYRKILVRCKDAKIPISHLAETVGVQRKTIYSHLDQAEMPPSSPPGS